MTSDNHVTGAVTDADRLRFESKVDQRGVDECWLWRGSKNKKGYGIFTIKDQNKRATRLALVLSGRPRPSRNHLACHTCDNPSCVNPGHLWWGTNQENMKDASAKGRTNKWGGQRRGEGNPNCKLTADDVAKIISLHGVVSQCKLGAMFGVSSQTIWKIHSGQRWARLPTPEQLGVTKP